MTWHYNCIHYTVSADSVSIAFLLPFFCIHIKSEVGERLEIFSLVPYCTSTTVFATFVFVRFPPLYANHYCVHCVISTNETGK